MGFERCYLTEFTNQLHSLIIWHHFTQEQASKQKTSSLQECRLVYVSAREKKTNAIKIAESLISILNTFDCFHEGAN